MADWIGSKRIAFIPVFRPRAIPPDLIPPDWPNLILSRVVFDPDPTTGADRSFRAWLRAASSGRAEVDPVVLPMETIDQQVVEANEFEGELGLRLRHEGFDHAAIVMLGDTGAGTNSGYWSRFVMLESTGVWVMEIIHGLTGFKDLYHFKNDRDPADRDIGTFDEMSGSSLTHPTVFTKAELGWLDQATIARYDGGTNDYQLQLGGLPQPPASGFVSAVRIGADIPYVMVEARKRNDQFDAGIASEGVIVYRVQTHDPYEQERPDRRKPLFLITRTALKVGESAPADNGVVVSVTGEVPGGFSIRVEQTDALPWTSVSEGASMPGAPVTAVLTGENRVSLFVTDPNGGIYTNSGIGTDFGTDWAGWSTVSEGASTPGAPVTAVLTGENRVSLFVTDPNGGIYTNSGIGTDWAGWSTVSEGASTPGAPVTAVLTGENRVSLFVTDPNGGIYTNSGIGTDWAGWSTVSEGASMPGAPVTAVLTGENRVSLFVTDPNGGIYTNSGIGTDWAGWSTVSEGASTPGAPVTAVLTGENRVSLFVTDPNGGIYTNSGIGTDWAGWSTVSEGASTPGAPVTAVLTGANRVSLFVTDPNGGIYTNSGIGTNWAGWRSVSQGTSTPGARVTAVLTAGDDRIPLFVTDQNGGILSSAKLLAV